LLHDYATQDFPTQIDEKNIQTMVPFGSIFANFDDIENVNLTKAPSLVTDEIKELRTFLGAAY